LPRRWAMGSSASDSSASATTTPPATVPAAASTTTTLGPGEFAITEVVFGLEGHVTITNVGDAPADLGGYRLCQRPEYFGIPPVTLRPGESVWVASGDGSGLAPSDGVVAVFSADGGLGSFTGEDGEMGLYATPAFSDPTGCRLRN